MKGQIRSSDLCIRTWPLEARLVALISGYFDDSQEPGDLWVIAGDAGYVNQWKHLECLWNAVLAVHDVPYFHMREMPSRTGPFAKWLPPEDHQEEVIAFFKDLVGAIRKCGLHMVASAAWIKDVERFNRDKGLALAPYPLAAYTCMSLLALKYDLPVTAIFDRADKVDSMLAKARGYANCDKHAHPGLCNVITSTPLAADLTARNVPAMQAADFIAWEVRKALFKMKSWQLREDRPLTDRVTQWHHFLDWTRESTGRDPVLRKSLDALISEMPLNSIVWDYQQISTTHEARRGIWAEDCE
jgi:hypothetical protein